MAKAILQGNREYSNRDYRVLQVANGVFEGKFLTELADLFFTASYWDNFPAHVMNVGFRSHIFKMQSRA
eukprot:1559692-Amphidinium_carterae.1